MQWMTMTSVVPCHAFHAPQHAAASPFGPLNHSNEFLRPSCRSRLYINGTGKSRYAGFFCYTPPHNSGGVSWFHVGRPCVCPSVRQSYVRPSVRFSFPDDNLSKLQWIFTKLSMCIDIVDIWFGIANGQILSFFYGVICSRHAHSFISGR